MTRAALSSSVRVRRLCSSARVCCSRHTRTRPPPCLQVHATGGLPLLEAELHRGPPSPSEELVAPLRLPVLRSPLAVPPQPTRRLGVGSLSPCDVCAPICMRTAASFCCES
jgi:hypothetical protein